MNYKQLQTAMLDVVAVLDKSGTNTKIYKEFFKNTDEKAFKKMVKSPDFKFRLETIEFEAQPTLRDILDIGEKYGIVMHERVINRRGPIEVLSPGKIFTCKLTTNRLQQRVEGEASSASDEDHTDKLGQVVGESKGAQVSDQEVVGCVSTGRKDLIKENFMIKSGNGRANADANKWIVKTGKVSLKDVDYKKEERKEWEVISANYVGMGIKVEE